MPGALVGDVAGDVADETVDVEPPVPDPEPPVYQVELAFLYICIDFVETYARASAAEGRHAVRPRYPLRSTKLALIIPRSAEDVSGSGLVEQELANIGIEIALL